jgi:hypothetical protein
MRQEPNVIVDKFRKSHPMYPDTEFGDSCGYFEVERTDGDRKYTLRMISSGIQSRGGWEHVSVSIEDRCPSWDDMCFVKFLFWEPEETVLQFHPAKSDYVNIHEFCLHLWRQVGTKVELPPTNLV